MAERKKVNKHPPPSLSRVLSRPDVVVGAQSPTTTSASLTNTNTNPLAMRPKLRLNQVANFWVSVALFAQNRRKADEEQGDKI